MAADPQDNKGVATAKNDVLARTHASLKLQSANHENLHKDSVAKQEEMQKHLEDLKAAIEKNEADKKAAAEAAAKAKQEQMTNSLQGFLEDIKNKVKDASEETLKKDGEDPN